jgi:hypothetical protein
MEPTRAPSANAATPASHAAAVADFITAGNMPPRHCLERLLHSLVAIALIAVVSASCASVQRQQRFASPEEGMSALVEAIRGNDQSALMGLLGGSGQDWLDSGDPATNAQRRKVFLKAYAEANKIVLEEKNTRAVLVVGRNEWPMPIPLVKSREGWRFDIQRAAEEILSRHIGRNELAAIQVCLAIVDAEHEYAEQDLDGDGVPGYASKLASSPGKRDGLYWETREGEPLSPLGPLLAAASEGSTASDRTTLQPYHGYFYRLLVRQGKDAPGGAYDYQINGKLLRGFAVLAYPARYGVSGVMSFIVNQDAVVYQNDLGDSTTTGVADITEFSPDLSWKRVP